MEKIVHSKNFRITNLTDSYVLHNVLIGYNERPHTIEIRKGALNRPTTCFTGSEEALLNFFQRQYSVGKDYPLPFPCLFGIIHSLNANKNHPDPEQKRNVHELASFLRESFDNNYIPTNSTLTFMPDKEILTHRYGLVREEKKETFFIGKNEPIKTTSTPEIYQLLCGTKCSPAQIDQDFVYLHGKYPNETKTIALKVDSESKRKMLYLTKIVSFFGLDDRVYINCGKNPLTRWHAIWGQAFD